MLNHKFTAREAGVILLLVAVIIGYLYYYVVYQYFEDEVAKYDAAELEEQIGLEQAKAVRLKKMQEELEKGTLSTSTLGVYNNQSEEILALSEILEGKVTNISISWGDPVLDGAIVRRDVTISFDTGSFEEAGDIIKEIADCEYTLLIVDMAMNESTTEEEVITTVTPAPTKVPDDEETADIEATEELGEADTQAASTMTTYVTKRSTSVSLTIRFFETTEGAANLNGLNVSTAEPEYDEDDDSFVPSTEELNEEING